MRKTIFVAVITSGSVSCFVSPVSFPIPAASNRASSLAWVSGSTGWMSVGKEDEVVDNVLLIPTTLEPNLDLVVISDDTDPIRVVLTPLFSFSRVEATLILEVSVALSIPTELEQWWVTWWGWFSGSLPSPATRNSSDGIFSVELRRFSEILKKVI